jgi:hypothetical protein
MIDTAQIVLFLSIVEKRAMKLKEQGLTMEETLQICLSTNSYKDVVTKMVERVYAKVK